MDHGIMHIHTHSYTSGPCTNSHIPHPPHAGLWVARREEQGHPLGLVPAPAALAPMKPALPAGAAEAGAPARTFVLEVGATNT